MREILFRAISIHGGRVYGYYAYTSRFSNNNDHYKHVIITKEGENKEIEPKTVGQRTGLEDKNGVKIYEGDIVDMIQDNKDYIKIIEYSCGYSPTRHAGYNISPIYRDAIEVIGNIHQHPHLIP